MLCTFCFASGTNIHLFMKIHFICKRILVRYRDFSIRATPHIKHPSKSYKRSASKTTLKTKCKKWFRCRLYTSCFEMMSFLKCPFFSRISVIITLKTIRTLISLGKTRPSPAYTPHYVKSSPHAGTM